MKYLHPDQLEPLRTLYTEYLEHAAKCKDDPSFAPYQSKYKALQTLEIMETKLNEIDENEKSEHEVALRCALLSVVGMILSDVEEFTRSEKVLNKCVELCDIVRESKYNIVAKIGSLNQLGIIWCMRDDHTKAKEFLDKSLSCYFELKNENDREIYLFEDLLSPDAFSVKPEQEIHLEMTITHTYYYLAQIYGKLGNEKKSAECCHETLSRQMSCGDYEATDWATNSAILSQFYLAQDNFCSARYHLMAAQHVVERTEDVATEEDEGASQKIRKCRSDVARFSGKYGLKILQWSRGIIDEEEERREASSSGASIQEVGEVLDVAPDEAVECPEFDSLDLEAKIGDVTAKRINDWDSAKETFIWSQKQLTAAKEYYTLDDHCADYVEINREMSQLYKCLAAYELDNDRKAKMFRRRVDLLDEVLTKLNPTHYLLVCRQLMFELGEIHGGLMEFKLERLKLDPDNQNHIKKANYVIRQAIGYFQTFLDSMKVEGKKPEKFNDESVRPALLAYFHIGRLASKFVVKEGSEQQMTNYVLAYSNYKEVVDYCHKYPEAADSVDLELSVCKEFVRLMPVKIAKMRENLKAPLAV